MHEMVQNHTFVGMADSILGLLQHGTRLYLANTTAITREMFYQQVIAIRVPTAMQYFGKQEGQVPTLIYSIYKVFQELFEGIGFLGMPNILAVVCLM